MALSPDCIDEARVFRDKVEYYDVGLSKVVEQEVVAVEVGHYTPEGDETESIHWLTTLVAAKQLGYGIFAESNTITDWLVSGEKGRRRLLITSGYDDEGRVVSLSDRDAVRMAQEINQHHRQTLESLKGIKKVRDSQ